MCVDPILWNCIGSRSYDFSRVWWVSGWERGPPPRQPRTNIWTSHTPLKRWDLGLYPDVWGVQIFLRGWRVAEEWCGPWCSDPTIYNLLTRLLFFLTQVSTLGYFNLRCGANFEIIPTNNILPAHHLWAGSLHYPPTRTVPGLPLETEQEAITVLYTCVHTWTQYMWQ